MANEWKILWGTTTDITATNLVSLADGSMWQSGEINDASPSNEIVRVSYEITFNATPVAGDSLRFYLAKLDEAASNEIVAAGLGTSEGAFSTAAIIAQVQAVCPLVHEHAWRTNHGTTFKGIFDIYNFGPSWQILVQANGEALSSGTQRVRRRYGSYQVQS